MNSDKNVISSFGFEWEKYDQELILNVELRKTFDEYFHIFPKHLLNKNAVGFDMGSGSGRWSYFVCEKVKNLTLIEPSQRALNASKKLFKKKKNINFVNATVSDAENIFNNKKFDFGYSIGVLHHVPNTLEALKSCRKLLKPGAPFLIYLYYNFENKGKLFKLVWLLTVPFRLVISRSPQKLKYFLSDIIAYLIYLPIKYILKIFIVFKVNIEGFPLSNYVNKSIQTLRTDSYDRFATRIEKRFSRSAIIDMLHEAGFTFSRFSNKQPYWTVLSYAKVD